MASIIFLLDTDVVSRAGLRNPPPALRPWMRAVGTSSLALCFPVIAELQRGAHLAARNDPEKGHRVSAWIDAILSVGFEHAMLTPAVAQMYARMTTTPGLKKLWVVDPHQKKDKLGHDIMIAAVAIANGMPIASCNTRDYLLIDQYFPLPGLFNPVEEHWHIALRRDDHLEAAGRREDMNSDLVIPTLIL
ncbi:type II toxin-antitoxin system VapC family toxin [Rhizobium giardinii]|uniref:type II toxin-antitoxin system VapC family toxin n=1 Tax=Rhizobium giardinii TaxID=56731 RepID=UPI003D6E95AC